MYNYLSSCIKDACCKEGHLVNKSVVGLFVVTDDFWEGPQNTGVVRQNWQQEERSLIRIISIIILIGNS